MTDQRRRFPDFVSVSRVFEHNFRPIPTFDPLNPFWARCCPLREPVELTSRLTVVAKQLSFVET